MEGNVLEIIQSVGFPIFICLACGYFIIKKDTQDREDSKAREERIFSQLDKFGSSLDKFAITLTQINEKLADK